MWTCSECRNDFKPEDKKYKFNLCHACYFTPEIAKLYRSGEKTPLPDSPPDLVEPKLAEEGVIVDNDGLMLATQREMDDDTFQLTIREKYAIRSLMKKVPPGRKPDINRLAYGLAHLKLLMFKLFIREGIEITPDMAEAFKTPPSVRAPSMDIFKIVETGRWSSANPPRSAMPRTSESFLEQLSKPPAVDMFNREQWASLASLREDPEISSFDENCKSK